MMGFTFTGSWVADLDRWLTTDPRDEVEPVCTCSGCDDGIYDGDDYYEIDGKVWCAKCVEDAKKTAEVDYPEYED